MRHASADLAYTDRKGPTEELDPIPPTIEDSTQTEWAGPSGPIGVYIDEERRGTLSAYRSQPNLVDEHANHEQDTARGGYAYRQLFELVQNSADALADLDGGRIELRLTSDYLYCADDGRAIDSDGVRALMFSHLSPKRGTAEIGRFGLGFKSVPGVTDSPEFFSRSGSFRFDVERAREEIRRVAPDAERYPALRLPVAIDPLPEMEADTVLRDLADWATNIVRLPLKPGARESLLQQAKDFPPEFLLFVEHVSELNIQADSDAQRSIRLRRLGDFRKPANGDQRPSMKVAVPKLIRESDFHVLADGDKEAQWMVVSTVHKLSEDARADSRSLDDATEVEIKWAAPVERLNEPGRFWAFFPTQTSSLLAGILNAPWKTNEDRQNLLPGVYNDELIDAAAAMVAKAVPRLSNKSVPARHLDALPRREEAGDSEHSKRLRDQLQANLRGVRIVPDQLGILHRPTELMYAPTEITDPRRGAARALGRWGEYEGRPKNWAHHSALTRNRLAAIRSVMPNRVVRSSYGGVTFTTQHGPVKLEVATVDEWLQALVDDADIPERHLERSATAIQTAALIPEAIRQGNSLGRIVLTTRGSWVEPDPESVFLGGGFGGGSATVVHPQLEADPETLSALKALGIGPASAETELSAAADKLLVYRPYYRGTPPDGDWLSFWRLARNVEHDTAYEIIQAHEHWQSSLRVRTIAEVWRSLNHALLPGPIIPADGSGDPDMAIDIRFHEADLSLLRQLGAVDTPSAGRELSLEHMWRFRGKCRSTFIRSAESEVGHSPRDHMLNFEILATTSGPLDVLELLSEYQNAEYTWRLLSLRDTYSQWTMRHDTRDIYPPMDFDSPALEVLREHGRIVTDEGIRPLSDGLGNPPKDIAVLRKLLSHPQADRIREAFGLPDDEELPVEPLDEDAPIPLLDEWPGLKPHITVQQGSLDLVRCDGFRTFGGVEPECVLRGGIVYVVRQYEEERELRSVLREIGVSLRESEIRRVLLGITPEDIQKARAKVRNCDTDEERLLGAVGERALRRGLPSGLLAILEEESLGALPGVEVAKAAIATYHTGALREYRYAIEHLDPPRQWAGRSSAIQFVRSLGFSDEWAGESNSRQEPFLEVDGPLSLPKLHPYQRVVVDNTRSLLRSGGALGERRGMISMPTGSGKTRVAVQAIVEAMRKDGFKGGVIWVADRRELCDQAVEAWREVWASEGTEKARLRISRMWGGQARPRPDADMHVIVATIQTLYAKTMSPGNDYDFLADFKLLVFDEAHRSISASSTSVMEELGLTRWRREHEPLLIGLTATPYRGRDEDETRRLVNRYGRNRLDSGAFKSDRPEDVISELQSMRVLARADHDLIEGGKFTMSPDELKQSLDTPWLPQSVESRIAGNAERTRRIIRAYHEHIGSDWPALVFATSVEHSQTVAALLTRDGIRARAVSANTEASVRRRIVEEFRAGEIDALVNYGIFREGFDAPRTRAIVVARPVYSPNLYFQMIGRGLRGVKNGGNDRCLILNVRDNIANYRRSLAFSELDWLWD